MSADKIKIMHLVSYLGYDGPSRGILGQIKYTDKNRFHNTICEIKPTRNRELVNTISDIECDHISLNKKPYDISAIFSLMRILKKRKIDILNTHNAIPCWYGNIAAKLSNIPAVFTLRNLQSENYKFILKKRRMFYEPIIYIDNKLMGIADKVVAVSDRLKDFYVNNTQIHKDKIMAISNAIDLEMIKIYNKKEVRNQMGISDNAVVIGIVGDIVERKGHACLADAAKLTVQKYPDTCFLIVGDGDMKGNIQQKIEELGISKHFIFTGHSTNVYPLLSIMDIFVLPSYAEGISRALMEAMAVGIPSVCSAIDGNLEAVVEGETGYTFAVNDHFSLADKLVELICDDKKRISMGENARNVARAKFNIANLAKKYEELYLQLIKGRAQNEA